MIVGVVLVVLVFVRVLDGLVHVLVVVDLGEVQPSPRSHQDSRDAQPPRDRVAEEND